MLRGQLTGGIIRRHCPGGIVPGALSTRVPGGGDIWRLSIFGERAFSSAGRFVATHTRVARRLPWNASAHFADFDVAAVGVQYSAYKWGAGAFR